jgi:PTS system nitrogen regulatory IIA component
MAMEKDDILFSSLFSPAEVICQTDQTNRDKVLLSMLRRLEERHNIGSIEEAYEAVVARENDMATVVAPGLAMPHARLETIDEIIVAVATSRAGILFDAGKSDNPVKLVVLTLTPKSEPGAYLQALSSLARICQNPSTADIVASLATPEQVWAFFHRGGVAGRGNPKSEARNSKQPKCSNDPMF